MDISKIRSLLGECFLQWEDPRGQSAEEDYKEAELALRALKSLFEQELHSRAAARSGEHVLRHDRKV